MARRMDLWKVPPTRLGRVEAQQRMLALTAQQDELERQIEALDGLYCAILEEKISLLKTFATLRFRP
jgi:hypothetical protein